MSSDYAITGVGWLLTDSSEGAADNNSSVDGLGLEPWYSGEFTHLRVSW